MPLESDISNADAQLTVRFFNFEIGEHKGQPFIEIMTPANQLSVIRRPMRESDKARFPRHWLAFQMENAGDFIGTPLKAWNEADPEGFNIFQMEELVALKFQTVEQAAQASDLQCQKIGMGGVGLREKARAFLKSKARAESTGELEQTKAQLAALQDQMTHLLATIGNADTLKRGPGRPKKDSVNVIDDDAATGATGHE